MTTYTDIVLHDTSNNYFIPYGLLPRLGDVQITNPTQGQNLTYDATNQVWKNTSTSATIAWGGITGTLADQTDLQNALNAKQAALVSGTNIKTLNGNSILGSGDLTLDGLPSQTGQSGKFLTTDGTDASWGNLPVATASTVGVVKPDNASIRVSNDGTLSAICRNVGEIISSTLPLTDAGLHLLDGSLILGGGIYQGFVDYIADLYTDNPTANYFTDETTWQSSVSTYGSCGKFVYDSTNNTVRLPKVSDILQGTTDLTALGNLVEAGLPNITGGFKLDTSSGYKVLRENQTTGAFGLNDTSNSTSYLNATSSGSIDTPRSNYINFDASRSSSIYGNSSTVQPQTIKVLYYIVLANSTKTEIQSDIDEIATDLNNKVGKNGDSVNGTYYDENDWLALVITNTNITDCDGTPTANTYSGIQFNDANGVRYGKLEGSWVTGGYTSFGFNALRRVNGSNVYAQVRSWVDANGNTYFDFPKCTTKPTQTSSATNNKVAVVTQNYKNGNSWYRVYSDGWCEQGATINHFGNITITFLKPFSDTNYSIFAQANTNATNDNAVFASAIINKQTSSVLIRTRWSTANFGDATCNCWMACGYIN